MDKRIKQIGLELAEIEREILFVDPLTFPVVHGLLKVAQEMLVIIDEIQSSQFKEEPDPLEETTNE